MEFVIRKTQEFGLSPKRQSRSRSGRLSLSTPEGPEKLAKIRQPKADVVRSSVAIPPVKWVEHATTTAIPLYPPNPALKRLPTMPEDRHHHQSPHYHKQRHPQEPRGRTCSVEPRKEDLLDFNFLHQTSALEHQNGQLMYRCASCLWRYPSLAVLQSHVALSWMDGFSCRVYYRKLREMHQRSAYGLGGYGGGGAAGGVRSSQAWRVAGSGKRRGHLTVSIPKTILARRESWDAPLTRLRGGAQSGLEAERERDREKRKEKEEDGKVLTLDLVKSVQRTSAVHKWLMEIEQPTAALTKKTTNIKTSISDKDTDLSLSAEKKLAPSPCPRPR
ncbi:uncharacterized protein LOC125285391 [Alosa alosa]|uniref:uncharacterized protein LOC125285391 n=1 Tax=Alosa alosa TaxID=278164 RepID=UPI002015334D|nr:uncharacterized protein LOC125285391 [Alosa alosa]